MQSAMWQARRHGGGPAIVLALLALCLGSVPAWSAEDRVTIEPRDVSGDVFSGKEASFEFQVRVPAAFTGRVGWTLFTTINRQTIHSSDIDISATPDKPVTVKIHVQIPELRTGVDLRTQLEVAVFRAGARDPQATFRKVIWILPEDPFANRKEWLKGLKISLFDPEKTTAKSLQDMKVPFDEVTNPAALGDLKEGLLIVGQGVSFTNENVDVPEALVRLASAGVPVLCVAPAGGSMLLPGVDTSKLPQPSRLSFRHQDVIRELDKRMDLGSSAIASRVSLKAREDRVVGEVSREKEGWPWIEADFTDRKSKLVVSGFRMFGDEWKASPAPRFLLARLLEYLKPAAEETSAQDKETGR